MKYLIGKNSTNKIIPVFIQDTSNPYGAGLTGVVPSSSGLICFYKRNTDTSLTQFSLVSGVLGSYIASGIAPLSNSIAPGDYELCLPNACFATGADFVTATLYGVRNMLPVKIDIQLVDAPIGYVATSGIAPTSFQSISEPTSAPSFPCTPIDMTAFMFARSKHINKTDAQADFVYRSDGTTVLASGAVSDNGTTFTRGVYKLN